MSSHIPSLTLKFLLICGTVLLPWGITALQTFELKRSYCAVTIDVDDVPIIIFSGWVVDNLDRNWQYRISVIYAGDEDTNTFICRTPRGRVNSINVVVTGN